MVTSDRPAPPRPESPAAIAFEMVRTPRFAFFADNRGVVYCEQVDQQFVFMSALGKTMGGKPTRYTKVLKWEGNEPAFLHELKDMLESGFTIERDKATVIPNIWGDVTVLKEVTDLKVGKKLRKICREGTPEAQALFGHNSISASDLDTVVDRSLILPRASPVQPFTDFVMGKINGDANRWTDFAARYPLAKV